MFASHGSPNRALAEAIDTLARVSVAGLGAADALDTLAELVVLARRLDAEVQRLVEEVDRTEAHRHDGALSTSAWLAGRCQVGHAEARSRVALARARSVMPAATAAHHAGVLSLRHLTALAGGRDDRTAEVFDAHEAFLCDQAVRLTPELTARVVRHWRGYVDPDGRHRHPAAQSFVSLGDTLDGWLDVRAGFADAEAALVHRAFDRMAGSPDGRPMRERRAAGLVALCDRFLRGEVDGGRASPHLNLLLRKETLDGTSAAPAVTSEGRLLSAADVWALLPGATVRRIVVDERGVPVDVGELRHVTDPATALDVALAAPSAPLESSERHATPALWAALWARDAGCSFPGCDALVDHTEAHHLVEWEAGGPTELDNLGLACRRHHRLVHEHGWRVVLGDDGRPVWLRPDGSAVAGRAPPPLP
jgi:hypothetical protein